LGKLRVLSGSEACKILEGHGFEAVRQRGSHRIMQLRAKGTTVTVPVPLHDTLRRGTLQSIIRQSGLAKSLFECDE
jgi:predicted RNA binding protein YcfA (HicA-like mRNA interferase family)